MVSYQQSKLIAIDKQPDDNVMHLGRSGKADRLTHEAFDPGAQRQVLTLYFLRVALAGLVFIRIEMTCVGAPRVGIILRDAKYFQQSLELEKHLICPSPQDVRQHVTTAVIYRVARATEALVSCPRRTTSHRLPLPQLAGSPRPPRQDVMC